MTSARDIVRRIGAIHLTGKAAALLGAGAIPALIAPGRWSLLVGAVWAAMWIYAVRRDVRDALGPAELEFERELPAKLSIGVANKVTMRVRSLAGRPGRLAMRETPPPEFTGERRIAIASLGPYESREVLLHFVPGSRGRYSFGNPGVRTLGPRGLAGRRFDVPLERECRVYPDITAVERYALLARRGMLHEAGIRAARLAGVGTEFSTLAEYVDGDDFRDIDWKATARRGSPVVRRFEAERSRTVLLAIDAGRLMTPRVGGVTKLDRAVDAALLLAYLASASGDLAGLLVFGRDVQTYVPPRRGHRQFLAILEALYPVQAAMEEPDYGRALRYLATRQQKRSLIVLFTELVGAEASGRLLRVLPGLSARHLPLVITQRNRELEERAVQEASSEIGVFEAAVAEDIAREKAAAVGALRARGALVLDVLPERLSVSAVNRFLEVKARGRL